MNSASSTSSAGSTCRTILQQANLERNIKNQSCKTDFAAYL